jgi:hypothetical protein
VLLDKRPVDDDHMGFADHKTHSGEPIQRKPFIRSVLSRRHAGNEMFRPTSPEICVVSTTADATTATTRTVLIRSSQRTGGIGGRECQIVDPTPGSR